MNLAFTKISATGNDFIVIDNRDARISIDRHRRWLSRICRRRVAVGADGVILIHKSSVADFEYVHINSDGSIAEMCGNGSRAVALYAFQHGIAASKMSFDVDGHIYQAKVSGNHVTTQFVPPGAPRFDLGVLDDEQLEEGGFVDLGVPHFVIFVVDVDDVDVDALGKKYRYHKVFAPRGANVDFVQVVDEHNLKVRTYERGVEEETLACGTGAVASAIISHLRKDTQSPTEVHERGGDLRIKFNEDFSDVRLRGTVDVIFDGVIPLPENA